MQKYETIFDHCQSQAMDPVRLTQLNVIDQGCLILTVFTILGDLQWYFNNLNQRSVPIIVSTPAEVPNGIVFPVSR